MCCSLFSFLHVSLHFCLVLFTVAYLRMLSFVFSHVCVLCRSYTCVVVSCLGSCVCDAMLESSGVNRSNLILDLSACASLSSC